MMWLILIVFSVFAIHDTVARPPKDVCAGATMRHGVGYNSHPYDCSGFVQCFYWGRHQVGRPVYKTCNFGQFWDQNELMCLPSYQVRCRHDKCRLKGVKMYKHADPNKCSAYWKCDNGRAYGSCCKKYHGFHKTRGCIPVKSCTSMCPLQDRVPGPCTRRPISGAPTQFEQYVGNGRWVKDRCTGADAYNPVDCTCSIKDVIKANRICKPDLVLNFDNDKVVDSSGYNNRVKVKGPIKIKGGVAYFNGGTKIFIDRLKPSSNDEGVLVIKMKYRDYGRSGPIEAVMTNGHCTRKSASLLIAKHQHYVLLGADAKRREMKKSRSRSFSLPTIQKPWKEIIYIKDEFKLEGRVCGASYNDWSVGGLVDTGCGYLIGAAKGMRGYRGALDDISIYRCKPLDAVINMNY